MQRYLDAQVAADLARKMVILTGPRQVGKTTLARRFVALHSVNSEASPAQYFNWDVPDHRATLQRGNWNRAAPLLVFDEVHKMRNWKTWLKGVVDGKVEAQRILVTGSARMETFRQSGPSLAGRFHALRLHPISVREWCGQMPPPFAPAPQQALAHLLARGGFPEPFLAPDPVIAARWRSDYFSGLIREDIVEFSRIGEINTMRLFVELLRGRTGAPLSLASIARDLAVSPITLRRYLDILEALFIVFIVRPWHKNIGRATLQMPKVYFFDNGLVAGDATQDDNGGARFENAVAAMLAKHTDFLRDTTGREIGLHYIRTKDGAEIDFAISDNGRLTELIECKWADTAVSRALVRFAVEHADVRATQLVCTLDHEQRRGNVDVVPAAPWLAKLAA